MKRLITFCTIMLISAGMFLHAQMTEDQLAAEKQKTGAVQASPESDKVVVLPQSTGSGVPYTFSESNPPAPPYVTDVESQDVIQQRVAPHAPDPNDPDYAAKKEAWKSAYPEEYYALLPEYSGEENTQVRVAQHAPDPSDPDYEAKKADWIKNYPEEYHALFPDAASDLTTPQEIQNPPQKLGDHGPYTDDPDFEVRKAEWIKNFPAEYNAFSNK